jgi:glycosyltransferase involved in cell wall biosynthesis
MVLISCITPTFNRKNLLIKAIESTIKQTYLNWEMIIVDDGSTDGTEIKVKEIQARDSRIVFYKNPGKGACSARNFALKRAKGKYIAFLDDDDLNLPHRFESQINAITKSSSRFILSGYQTMNSNGLITSVNTSQLKGKGAGIGIRWFIEKDLLFQSGLFDESMPSMQEVELSYRIADYEVFANHKDVVVIAGQTVNSISRGLSGIHGKELLIKKHKNNMPDVETSWWYFTLGLDYYSLNDIVSARQNIKKSALLSKRLIYKFGYLYTLLMLPFGGLIKKANQKILYAISNFRYPNIVNHPVID